MFILVTGAAGFIGYHLTKRLLELGHSVVGFDNLNPYYDPSLKLARVANLDNIAIEAGQSFELVQGNIHDFNSVQAVFSKYSFKYVVNLAAQAGVRYSIENPSAYIQSNLVGFGHILEACRQHKVQHLVYASSSSVYGGNTSLPFSEHHSVDHPVSLYAATKKSNELMAHAYSHLYSLPATGLRFFTVYGPWGRPDMALFLFTKAILERRPIQIFNNGNMTRDFTYIDDIVESLVRLLDKPPSYNPDYNTSDPDPASSWAPHKVFNIGNSTPTSLMAYIDELEKTLGLEATKEFFPMQPGDVAATAADTSSLESWINFKPSTPIHQGVSSFVSWYREYYNA